MLVKEFTTPAALHDAAAQLLFDTINNAVNSRGMCSIALAGGSSPRPTYEKLTELSGIPWDNVHIFWGDERYVPLDSQDSNYCMASAALLSHIPIPEKNVHPVPVDLHPCDICATNYEYIIHKILFLNNDAAAQKIPKFDIVLLGIGPDGHTASLFPDDTNSLNEATKYVVATPPAPLSPHVQRITFTFPLINAARHRLFLIPGIEKKPHAQLLCEKKNNITTAFPAARVTDKNTLLYFSTVSL